MKLLKPTLLRFRPQILPGFGFGCVSCDANLGKSNARPWVSASQTLPPPPASQTPDHDACPGSTPRRRSGLSRKQIWRGAATVQFVVLQFPKLRNKGTTAENPATCAPVRMCPNRGTQKTGVPFWVPLTPTNPPTAGAIQKHALLLPFLLGFAHCTPRPLAVRPHKLAVAMLQVILAHWALMAWMKQSRGKTWIDLGAFCFFLEPRI